jgi:proteasome lid subunit RPN8/RPN11
MNPPPRIFLPPAAVAAMAAAAAAAWPAEACGLLVGEPRPEGMRILLFQPIANAAEEPRRGYLVPPLALLETGREARCAGREIVGIWHSHPDSPVAPSRRDAEEAWQGYSYGIQAATREGAGELRFFALRAGAFHEVPWVLAGDES